MCSPCENRDEAQPKISAFVADGGFFLMKPHEEHHILNVSAYLLRQGLVTEAFAVEARVCLEKGPARLARTGRRSMRPFSIYCHEV